MPELFTPPELFRNQPANFRIRLEPSDPEGVYQFRFQPVYGAREDIGFVQSIITRVMRRGNVDADLEVRFRRAGERLLEYHFVPELDDLLTADDDSAADDRAADDRAADDAGADTTDAATGGKSGEAGSTRTKPARKSAERTESATKTRAKTVDDAERAEWQPLTTITVLDGPVQPKVDRTVALAVTPAPFSPDQELWFFIRRLTERMRFAEFHEFVQPRMVGARGIDWTDTGAYELLQRLSIRFLQIAADPQRAVANPRDPSFGEISPTTARAGVLGSYVSDEDLDLAQPFLGFDGVLTGPFDPFSQDDDDEDPVRRRLRNGNGHNGDSHRGDDARARAEGGLRGAAGRRGVVTQFPLPNVPFVELIWAYWMDECGLAQTMNLVLARFQNRRVGGGRDVLSRFNANPLLPIANLLWGFAEAEEGRLTVRRRAAEYRNMYGLPMQGKAVPPASAWIDDRSQFLSAFHNLLNATYRFYKERDDKTVDADAFPLLSSLQELHLVLAYGAHNQFPALALRTRREFLVMQWILAQPELREFLGGPTMVPQEEQWMDRVDTMKELQGWSPTSVTHFLDLALCGEQILLTVRHGRWNESTRTRDDAANWAITWRNEIQRYVHAYRAVTGVDLQTGVDATPPSVLLARRERGPARG
jgi:hypothetical protein